jgi:hypothetical protein
MVKIEPADGKLRVDDKTFIRTLDSTRMWDLALRADQVTLVTSHNFSGVPEGTRDKRPIELYVAIKGQATIEGSGAGLAILGSETPPAVQLSIDIVAYNEPELTDGSVWAERARTSWPGDGFKGEDGWHLTLGVPRPVHDQLTIAAAAGRLAHLKFKVKLDAWMEEKLGYFDDPVVYLAPQKGHTDETDSVQSYITQLVLKERPLMLTEPAENAAPERSITGPRRLVELRSELAAVQKAVWAVFAAVVLIGIFLLMKF